MEGWQPNHQDSVCFLKIHHTNLKNHKCPQTPDPLSMDMFRLMGSRPHRTIATVKIHLATLQTPHPKYPKKKTLVDETEKNMLFGIFGSYHTGSRASMRTTMANMSLFVMVWVSGTTLLKVQRALPVLALSWWRWSSHSTCEANPSISGGFVVKMHGDSNKWRLGLLSQGCWAHPPTMRATIWVSRQPLLPASTQAEMRCNIGGKI